MPHGSVFPLAFTVPGSAQLHNLSTEVGDQRVGWISLEIFVDEVTDGAEAWIEQQGATQTVIDNLDKFARLRPEGLHPHLGGAPVIA